MTRRLIMEGTESVGSPAGARYQLYESEDRNPEVYIDGIQGAVWVGNIVKLNCFTRGANVPVTEPQGIEQREVACRLVMGVDTLLNVIEWLKAVETDIRSKLATASLPQPPQSS